MPKLTLLDPKKPIANDYYEYISMMGFTSIKEIGKKTDLYSINNLFIVAANCYMLTTNLESNEITKNFFDFAANQTLSGDRYPCEFIIHRMYALNSLLTFCYLYSDTVSILNPFEFMYGYISGQINIENKHDEILFRKKIQESMLLMQLVQPAIESKRIVFAKMNFTACKNCMPEFNKLQKIMSNKLYGHAVKVITSNSPKSISMKLLNANTILVRGLSRYFSDGEDITLTFIKPQKRYVKLWEQKKTILGDRDVKDYVNQYLINNAVDSVMMHYGPISEGNNRTFLTNNQIEAEILSKIKKTKGEFTPDILRGLNHMAPFIEGADLNRISKFRMKYNQEFENYRNSIKQFLEETKSCKSQKEFETALHDIVDINLNKLDEVFENKQSEIFDSITKGSFTCFISIGLGIMNQDLSLVSAGLIEGAYSTTHCLKEQFMLEQKQKKNEYYFIWKIKKTTKK